MANLLQLTQVGYDAAANADAGGFKIKLTDFTITQKIDPTPPNLSNVSLEGVGVFSGKITVIENLGNGLVRFTMDLPIGIDDWNIRELGIFLESGTLFARCTFAPPIVKDSAFALRMYALLSMSSTPNNSLTVDVTVGDNNSLPSISNVYALQPPSSSDCNAVVVLDQRHNYDNVDDSSASVAIKSADGTAWSFLDYTRIYLGAAVSTATAVSNSCIKFDSTFVTKYGIKTGDYFIVQIVGGSGQGHSRRFYYNGTDCLENDSQPFSGLNTNSIIAVWKSNFGNPDINADANPYWPPDMDNVDPTFILMRGDPKPKWVSTYQLFPDTDPLSVGLTIVPGNLKHSIVYFTGDGRKMAFDTGLAVTSNETIVSISGITQHKESYDVQGNFVVFSEAPPPNTSIEIIVFEHEDSAGTFLEFHTTQNRAANSSIVTSSYITDGITRSFRIAGTSKYQSLGQPNYPTDNDSKYVFCWITGIKQTQNAYSVEINNTGTNGTGTSLDPIPDPDQHAYLIFNEAPKPGLEIQITWYRKIPTNNFNTIIVTNTFVGTGVHETLALSETPEDYNYVFVYVSGVLLHSDKYTLNGNHIVIPDAIKKDLPIMVIMFINKISQGAPSKQFSGVVTGAVVSDRYLKLQRYNAPEFLVPMQHVELYSGDGIEVVGEYPSFLIKTTASSKASPITKRFSTLYTLDDVEEIIYSYKFFYDSDYIVSVTADFSCRLGPGFRVVHGEEHVEYVVGFKTLTSNEPPYGRRVKGTGFAGFSYLQNSQLAYCNASITQSFELSLNKTTSDTVTFVAKMRVRNASVSSYNSAMDVNFSLVAVPKYTG